MDIVKRRIAVVAAGLSLFTLVLTVTPHAVGGGTTASTGRGDVALYTAIVGRLRAGVPYYDAVGTELRARHYPTRPVVNWRQPALFEFLALVSPSFGRIILSALALLLVMHARPSGLGMAAMTNVFAFLAATEAMYFVEAWCGIFIAFSVVAYARGRTGAGIGFGLAALFVRELAAVYCVTACLIALRRRRWKELIAWLGGAVVYFVYFGTHAWLATQHIRATDLVNEHSWFYGGGLPFVLQVWQFNGLLWIAPTWVFAVATVLYVAGAWDSKMPVHVRASVVAYSLFFVIVGQPFDIYWGFLTCPLIALWAGHTMPGLRALWGQSPARPALNAITEPPAVTGSVGAD